MGRSKRRGGFLSYVRVGDPHPGERMKKSHRKKRGIPILTVRVKKP